jgi:hypothetical protein
MLSSESVVADLRLVNVLGFIIGFLVRITRLGGAWGERMYSSYSFLTSALDGGGGGGEWSGSTSGNQSCASCKGSRTAGNFGRNI